MFAVGHLSLGYLFATGTAKLLKQDINLPLIFLLALIPDVDIIIPGVEHRTLTHSLVVATVVFLPLFTHYKTQAVPYFIALIQHSLVGDILTGNTYNGGTQLLWPLTSTFYGFPVPLLSAINITLEWGSFLLAMAVMLRTKDLQKLLTGHLSNLAISVPTLAVLLPTSIYFPLPVPMALIIPHLTYLLLFAIAIANSLRTALIPKPSSPGSAALQ